MANGEDPDIVEILSALAEGLGLGGEGSAQERLSPQELEAERDSLINEVEGLRPEEEEELMILPPSMAVTRLRKIAARQLQNRQLREQSQERSQQSNQQTSEGQPPTEAPPAARDATALPGGGQGGFAGFQNILDAMVQRNAEMRDMGENVQGGPGILSLLLPTPGGGVGAGAGRMAQGFTRTPRGPTPADLERAGRVGSIEDILRLSNAERTRTGFETLARLVGGGPAGTGASVNRGVLTDQLIPLALETGLRARKGELAQTTQEGLARIFED